MYLAARKEVHKREMVAGKQSSSSAHIFAILIQPTSLPHGPSNPINLPFDGTHTQVTNHKNQRGSYNTRLQNKLEKTDTIRDIKTAFHSTIQPFHRLNKPC